MEINSLILKLWVNGEVGYLGQHVQVTVGSQDPEIVTILLQQMEENIVQVLIKILHPVLEVNVHQYMDSGEVGYLGQHVAKTV